MTRGSNSGEIRFGILTPEELPMDTVAQVAAAMQRVLTQVAERAGVESGMIRRRRKLSGASFIQALVFGWLAGGGARLGSLNQAPAAGGESISPTRMVCSF